MFKCLFQAVNGYLVSMFGILLGPLICPTEYLIHKSLSQAEDGYLVSL